MTTAANQNRRHPSFLGVRAPSANGHAIVTRIDLPYFITGRYLSAAQPITGKIYRAIGHHDDHVRIFGVCTVFLRCYFANRVINSLVEFLVSTTFSDLGLQPIISSRSLVNMTWWTEHRCALRLWSNKTVGVVVV